MATTHLQQKKCLITGAASGIGRALALAMACQGTALFLTDINAAGLEQTAQTIRELGGHLALMEALDITDYDAVSSFAHRIHDQHGSLDLVLNVAGISTWGSIDNLHHEDWRRNIEINLMGPIQILEQFVPAMIQAGRGGHVVNVASAAALLGLPWHAAYSASKFGLRGVSEVLRFDLRRHGIGVSLVCPGGVDTGLVDTVQIRGVDTGSPRLQALKQRFKRHAVTPEHAAETILKGIRANRYLIFTSADIRAAHWLQRYCPPLYGVVMQRLNDYMVGQVTDPA